VNVVYDLAEDLISTSLPDTAAILNSQVLVGGKRLRPALCFLMGEILLIKPERLERYAMAAERVHNATLIHDDVIDEAPRRRGRATLSASGLNKRAVLAGDLLLARALKDVSAGGVESFEILRDLNHTLVELVEGEWLQLEAQGSGDRDERHLREVARKKTASLLSWCCKVSGRVAGVEENVINSLSDFGYHLGVGFQMIDDCLDFSTTAGKLFCQDLFDKQINFVTFELIKENSKLKNPISDCMGKRLTPPNCPWTELELKGACEKVRIRAEFEINVGLEKIRALMKSQVISLEKWEVLRGFCNNLVARDL
jgi:geranylgeranyl pyrophosphate synthase